MVNEWLVIIHVFRHIVAPLAHLLRCAVGVVILTGHDTCADGLNENPPVDRSCHLQVYLQCLRWHCDVPIYALIKADVLTLGMDEDNGASMHRCAVKATC